MNGIHYVTDSKGRKKAVIIDLKKHGALWEDFQDSLSAHLRVEEPRETYESVKRRLRRKGKLETRSKSLSTKDTKSTNSKKQSKRVNLPS